MVHARNVHGTDFSGLVTKLLIADLGEAYVKQNLASRSDEVVSALKRTLADEDRRLEYGPRAHKGSPKDLSSEESVVEHAAGHTKRVTRQSKKRTSAASKR